MSTRSLTYVYDGHGEKAPIVMCMYRQSDGYPSYYGLKLAEFLAPIKLVNGIADYEAKIANGAGCLAAQIVKHFKDGVGNIYLYPHKKGQDADQEYEYHIHCDPDKQILFKIIDIGWKSPNAEIFTGTPLEAIDFINSIKET